MNDFINQPLSMDDYVVITIPKYRSLTLGKILGFTPKKVKIVYRDNWGLICRTLVFPNTLVRVDKTDALALALTNPNLDLVNKHPSILDNFE